MNESLRLAQRTSKELQPPTTQEFKAALSEIRNNDAPHVDNLTKELATNSAPTPYSIKPKTID